MRGLPLLLVTFSAVFAQSRTSFDTTVSLRMLNRDSLYIPPIQAFIYYQIHMTASCPAYVSGDFSDWHATNLMEKIPAQAQPLIRYTAPCGPGPSDTTFTFDDRQYKLRTGTGDVFMRVTGMTKAFRVSLNFSSDPFPSTLRPRSQGSRTPLASRSWKGFQGVQVRNPRNQDWHLMDGRHNRER